MKSIIFILPSMKRGGAETQTVHLANGFVDKGFHVHLISLQGAGDLNTALDPAIHFIALHRRSKLDVACVRQIRSLVRRERPDALFCAMQFAFLYGWLSIRFLSSRPHLVSSLHTTLTVGWKEELQDRLIYQYILRGASRNIYVCKAQRQYWIEKYPALSDSSEYIYNGIDPAHFKKGLVDSEAARLRESFAIAEDDVVIASVAGFRVEKNHIGLVRAFASLPKNTRLLLVGDGPLRASIEEEVSRLGIGNRVHFCGLMQDVRPALELADVLAMPSIAVETFSLAMLEAMSMQVVPVVSDIGGQKEAFVQGESGFSYPMENTAQFVELLRSCAERKQELKTLGVNARQRVVEKFSKQLMIDNTVAMVESL